jgi:hypothetical protein
MKKILFPVCVGLILFAACKDTVPPAPVILYSFGFEDSSGVQDFEGWSGINNTFVNDVPGNGGNWSLQLSPGVSPAVGYAENDLTFTGTGTFNIAFTAAVKTTGTAYIALLHKHSGGSVDTLSSATYTNSTWQPVSLNASADLAAGDKFGIYLSAGSTVSDSWQSNFDNIQLQEN